MKLVRRYVKAETNASRGVRQQLHVLMVKDSEVLPTDEVVQPTRKQLAAHPELGGEPEPDAAPQEESPSGILQEKVARLLEAHWQVAVKMVETAAADEKFDLLAAYELAEKESENPRNSVLKAIEKALD